MARLSVSLFGALVTAVALGVPAQGAVAAPTPPQDFVVGGGDAGDLTDIVIDAHSDPTGGNPTGTVSVVAHPFPGIDVEVGGPVTCLAVDGNRAVIGFVIGLTPATAVAVDNGSGGSPPDGFNAILGATDCSTEPFIEPRIFFSGGLVIYDAPSIAQCRDGDWRNYTDATGQLFKNQGECITFALGVA